MTIFESRENVDIIILIDICALKHKKCFVNGIKGGVADLSIIWC